MNSKLQKQKQILAMLNAKSPPALKTADPLEGGGYVTEPDDSYPDQRLINQIFQFHKSIIQNINAGLITTDLDGEITFANKIAARLLGYEPEDFSGRNIRFFFQSPPAAERFLSLCAGAGRKISDWETVLIRQNRQEIIVGIDAAHFEDATNHFTGIVCLLRDLTEVHHLRSQVERMERLALLGELSAGIAHEVRNPMAGIKAATQLLEEQGLSDPLQVQLLERIVRETDRANRLLKEFFKFAKPTRPQADFHDLQKIVDHVYWLLAPRLKQHNIRYESDFAEGLPRVYTDESQLEQVLLNICLNGIEAMPEGGVLSLRGRKKKLRPLAPRRQSEQALQPPLDYVQVEIADSGPGIPENDLKKIFNPFYTTKTEGAGLGLSICSRLVEENNGKIDVVSHKDQGTKFILALPTFASR